MVNTRKNSCPIGYKNKDQVISNPEARTAAGRRAPGPGLKPQDNNASFEGISEAEYNKRHMKALKDAEPSGRKKRKKRLKRKQAPSLKLQAPSEDNNL